MASPPYRQDFLRYLRRPITREMDQLPSHVRWSCWWQAQCFKRKWSESRTFLIRERVGRELLVCTSREGHLSLTEYTFQWHFIPMVWRLLECLIVHAHYHSLWTRKIVGRIRSWSRSKSFCSFKREPVWVHRRTTFQQNTRIHCRL